MQTWEGGIPPLSLTRYYPRLAHNCTPTVATTSIAVGSTLPPIATLQTVDAVDFRTRRVTSAVVGASSTIPRRMSMYSGYGAGGVSAPKSPSVAVAAARAITRSPSPSSVEPQSLNTVAADRIPNFVSNHIRMFLDDRLFVENLDLLTRTFNDEVDATGAEWLVPKLEPSAVESFAAVVMADVSGYSKLTAYLAEKGDSATEYLARTMKGYLDKVGTSTRLRSCVENCLIVNVPNI